MGCNATAVAVIKVYESVTEEFKSILKCFDDGVKYCVVMVLWTLSIVRRVKY
jgi:hypothetical protein